MKWLYATLILPAVLVVWLQFSTSQKLLNDLSIYDRADWWNPNVSFSILHKMNNIRIPYFVRQFPAKSTRSVIDIGCGGGQVSELMAKDFGFNVTGIDISRNSLEIAKLHASQSNVTVTYMLGSIYSIPIDDGQFDAVIVSDVLEHLHDIPLALSEIFRVLKPGGVLVFDTINRTWWSWLTTYMIAQEILGIVEPGAHDWNMFITPTELESFLIQSGFTTNASTWSGIVGKLNFSNALQLYNKYELISHFIEDKLDLSCSYMGYAQKP